MRRSRGFGLAFGVVVGIGCGQVINGGSNGEGGQCTFVPNDANNNAVNGTDECQAGLICYSGLQFADYSEGFTFDRCCPPFLSPTDPVAVCRSSGSVTGGSPTAGADADVFPADGEAGSIDLDVTLPPLDAALATLSAAPPGLAGFAFIVNDVVQNPMVCPTEHWEFAYPYPMRSSEVCSPSCPGIESVILVNTGTLPMAYLAGAVWELGGNYVPGVNPGANPGGTFEAGVLNAGDYVDITPVYSGGVVGLVGSAEPFSSADASFASDEGTIPWPKGVAGSGAATTMNVAEIEVRPSCMVAAKEW